LYGKEVEFCKNLISLCKIVFDFGREDVLETEELEGVNIYIVTLIYFG